LEPGRTCCTILQLFLTAQVKQYKENQKIKSSTAKLSRWSGVCCTNWQLISTAQVPSMAIEKLQNQIEIKIQIKKQHLWGSAKSATRICS